jgi:hypothetical protein
MGKRWLAAVLSLLVPGLGQIVLTSRATRGAMILGTVLIVGNLNAVWLSVYPIGYDGPALFYSVTLPRALHDLFALYGIIFWIWQVVDAWRLAGPAPAVV